MRPIITPRLLPGVKTYIADFKHPILKRRIMRSLKTRVRHEALATCADLERLCENPEAIVADEKANRIFKHAIRYGKTRPSEEMPINSNQPTDDEVAAEVATLLENVSVQLGRAAGAIAVAVSLIDVIKHQRKVRSNGHSLKKKEKAKRKKNAPHSKRRGGNLKLARVQI